MLIYCDIKIKLILQYQNFTLKKNDITQHLAYNISLSFTQHYIPLHSITQHQILNINWNHQTMLKLNTSPQKSKLDTKNWTMGNSQSQREIKTLNVQKLQKYVLAIDNQFVESELAVYQWRKNTQFPIVKITNCSILKKLQKVSHVQIVMENYPAKLSELQEIPLFKTIYLLKQSLIGLERLADKFGTFYVTPQMIAIDKNNKCKVWVNQTYSMNHPLRQNNQKPSQKQFLSLIIQIFAQKTIYSAVNNKFFFQLKDCPTILKALKYTEQFCKTNKLQVPKQFKIINTTIPKSQTSRNILFNNRGTFSHAPKILEQFKSSQEMKQFKGANTFSKNDKQITNKINQLMNKPSSAFDFLMKQRTNSIQKATKTSITKRLTQQPTQRKQTKLKKVNASAFKNFRHKPQRDNSIKTLKKLPDLQNSQQIEQTKFKTKDSILTAGMQTRTSGFGFGSGSGSGSGFPSRLYKKYSDLSRHDRENNNSHTKDQNQKDEFQKEVQDLFISQNIIADSRMPSMIINKHIHQQEETNLNSIDLINSTSTKFMHNKDQNNLTRLGDIDDQPEQPTHQETVKMYQKNGWIFNNLLDQDKNMKLSIHQNQRNRSPKKPVQLKMLDRIKAKKMYESILSDAEDNISRSDTQILNMKYKHQID